MTAISLSIPSLTGSFLLQPSACLIFLFGALSFGSVTAGELAAVTRLPELTRPATWSVTAEDAAGVTLSESGGYLLTSFRAAKDTTARVLLKEPVAVPDWATDFTFRCTNNGATSGLWLRVIVRDADGKEFRFQTRSRFSFEGGVFHPEHAERRAREDRFHTPGLERAVLVTVAGGTIMPPKVHLAPKRPYTLLGFELEGDHQKPADSLTWLYLTDFAFTRLTPTGTAGYYLFRDQEQYAEREPVPFLTVGDFGRWFGRRFDIAWEVRREFAGQPVLAGAQSVRMPVMGWENSDKGRDYPIRLAERVTLPVTGEGTWWVRAKVRWFRTEGAVPTEILTRDYRLDVLKGTPPGELQPWPADVDLPGSFVRVAPERRSLVWAPAEPFRCGVRFARPAEGAATMAVVEVCTAGDGTQVRRQAMAPAWDDNGRFSAEVDLADQPPGAYRVRSTLLAGDKVMDEVVRLIGRQGGPAAPAAIPAGVPAARELRDGVRPLFHLSPLLDESFSKDPLTDWAKYWQPFLDKAGDISKDLELQVPWNEVEPLPGVFDWRGIDRFVDYARDHGYQVLLWPEFRANNVPKWLPGCFEHDPAGRVFGCTSYLFHGTRPNYTHAAPVRDGVRNLVRAVAERYRGHAGVQGYFFCFEHPSDAPYAGWYEGYAAESVAEFREHARRELGTLDAANGRWRTAFATWADVVPPSRLGEFTDRYWADWLRFRADSIGEFLKGLVSTARTVDPHRLIVVYGDGAREPGWFRDQGCMLANGGSHDAMHIPGYAATGLLGLPERTEDHSPGNWTAYFPTQPDASVFAMMTGGGVNAHCKAYVRIRFGLEDAKDPEVSLGRYKRFMPIWQALRQTAVPPTDTRFFPADDGRLLSGRSTWGAWGSDTWAFLNAMQAHVPIAAGKADLWREACLLMLPTTAATVLDDSTMDGLARYAEEGGALLMWGDSGRRSLDRPDEDWVLLRRFGFTPPAGPCLEGRRVKAVPVQGDVFPATAKPFAVRDYWDTAVTPGTNTVATINGDAARPLVVWRPVGKGRAMVIWGQTVLPPMTADADANYAFLRDVARWAGARLTTDSDQPLFWLNLLAGRDGKSWFGLVHVGQWQGVPNAPASGPVRWLALPDGEYHIKELVHQRDLGRFSGEALRTTGLPVTLGPREVAIYQISSVAK